MRRSLAAVAAFLLPMGAVTAGAAQGDIMDLSLADLLNTEVQVASKTPRRLRQSPGVVTIVTREEIVRSGARDMVDVLHLVPGFAFAVDVEMLEGIGFRGNWGSEGKISIQIDGMEINDVLWGQVYMNNHLQVHNIKRVEIVRGPGSMVHGGHAELAVVNIITRHGEDIGGWSVTGTYGQLKRTFGHRGLSATYGDAWENGLALSASAHFQQSNLSGAHFSDFYGDRVSLANDNARVDPSGLNVGLTFHDLRARFIYDRLDTTQRDAYDVNLPHAVETDFEEFHALLAYDWHASETLTITPELSLRRQTPLNVDDPVALQDDYFIIYDNTGQRLRAALTASWEALQLDAGRLTATLGGAIHRDSGHLNDRALAGDSGYGPNYDLLNVYYTNVAGFGELVFKSELFEITGGVRAEEHSEYGSAYAPRVALTSLFGPMHFKLLYAHAFRSPSIENINFAFQDVEPERTRVLELEIGCEITRDLFIAANAFDITINDPIVYFYDDSVPGDVKEGYANFSKTGTRGAELDVRFKQAWGYINANYSFYSARDKNEVELYATRNPAAHLALPQHKAALNSSFDVVGGLYVSPSLVVFGPRYGFLRPAPDSNPDDPTVPLQLDDPRVLANLFIGYRDLAVAGLSVGVGLYNAFNENYDLIQPHDSFHAPVSVHPRELLARVTYSVDL